MSKKDRRELERNKLNKINEFMELFEFSNEMCIRLENGETFNHEMYEYLIKVQILAKELSNKGENNG